MDVERYESALAGLRRIGDTDATRAADHVGIAVAHSRGRAKLWAEQMCYSLREALEEIPVLFGQKRQMEPLGPVAKRFLDRINDAVAINSPPDVLRDIAGEFHGHLEVAQTQRRFRIAQAMLIQTGTATSSARVDAFAEEWTRVVEGVNRVLHGGGCSDDHALRLRDRAIDLIGALVGPISYRLAEMDTYTSQVVPSAEDLPHLLDLLADERLAKYFYANAQSPSWLQVLDDAGLFSVPMQGDWHQAELLIRDAVQVPTIARGIAVRLANDPHPAAAVVMLGVAKALGPADSALAVQALRAPAFPNPFRVAQSLEDLLSDWSALGGTAAFSELADAALEPTQAEGPTRRGTGKFRDFDAGRLVRRFVEGCGCEDLPQIVVVLGYKLRRVIELAPGGGVAVSFARSSVDEDDPYERDIDGALISGIRNGLRRLRECGDELSHRRAVLGDLEEPVFLRLWANHLAEEEQT